MRVVSVVVAAVFVVVTALFGGGCGGGGGAISGAVSGRGRGNDPGIAYDAALLQRFDDGGKAEVTTYKLVRTRHGEARDGVVVAVVAREPWSVFGMVKDEDARPGDRADVLRLHTLTSFATGLTDSRLATSAFVNLQPFNGLGPGNVVKIAFSAHDWDGQVYHEYLNDGKASLENVRSWVVGETEGHSMPLEPGVLFEDSLLLWLRGLAGPATPVKLQTSLERNRLDHAKTARIPATVTRAADGDVERVGVKAGDLSFDAVVERGGDRRVLSLSSSDGTSLTLVKSERVAYDQLQRAADAGARSALGLAPISGLAPTTTTTATAP